MPANGVETGLALGGGAGRGWAHVGVLRALTESGLRVTHVAGTSIGALVGAFAAAGKTAVLTDTVAKFGPLRFLRLFDPGWSGTGLVGGRRVEAFLRDHLGDACIEDLPVRYAAVATDLLTGGAVVLDRGPLVTAVRASIAIPGVFTPVESEGRLLADGGLLDPMPVGVVRRLGAARVIAVGLNRDIPAARAEIRPRRWFRGRRRRHLLDVVGSALVILEQQLTEARLRDEPADLLIQPGLAAVGLTDFDRPQPAIEAGYEAARAALADWNP
ncbi:MAG: NTE family protein RssA [Lentisphaerae bacterium ADurb.BinA184]|nr:MAG: NTE family protein RssA [Lentisphaerae bacterium ADurb.BinA184]